MTLFVSKFDVINERRPVPLANQERELREVASLMGCDIVKVYRDHGVSGAKGRDKRPQFHALCREATQRKFDMIMAWSVDRLGRPLQDLVAFLFEIHALKIHLYLHQQGLDTTTPAGKLRVRRWGGPGSRLAWKPRSAPLYRRRHRHAQDCRQARRRNWHGAAGQGGNGRRALTAF
jgi:hypothetical protein